MQHEGPCRPEVHKLDGPRVSTAPNLATKAGLDRRDKEMVVPSEAPILPHAPGIPLASLDDSLAVLWAGSEKLKAASSVNIPELIEQLTMAVESARMVRASVSSELPEASWQNREELDALIQQIQENIDARELEHLRSRLLALAQELEDGSIVHRRALRVNELNQLRDQAIHELRSQAAPEAVPHALPGPEADRWIEWACGLKDPEDAEFLQILRNGFTHLDNFVANLEPNMWRGTGAVTSEFVPEAETPPANPEPSGLHTSAVQHLMTSGPSQGDVTAAKSSAESDEPRFPQFLYEPSTSAIDTDTLTPNFVIPQRSEAEIQRLQAQERALVARMTGAVSVPVRPPNRPVEPPVRAEVLPKASVAPAVATHPIESPLATEIARETSAEPTAVSALNIQVKKLWSEKGRMLLAIAAVIVLAVLGIFLWRGQRNKASNGPLSAVETKIPTPTPAPAQNQASAQNRVSLDSKTHNASPKAPPEKPPKAKDQSAAPKPLPNAAPARQATNRNNAVLHPPETPKESAVAKNGEPSPNGTAETPSSVPSGVPGGVSNNVVDVVKNIPVAEPKIAAQKVRVSSGLAQGLLVHQVTPQYPARAKQMHIQGSVVLEAVIRKDGTVQNLHALSGSPLLVQAAMDAVRQWRYKPYLLNGEPVEAETQINVNFTLPGG